MTTTKWTIDPAHSEILFKVKHMMISTVKGEFKNFKGEVISQDNDFSQAQIAVSIDAASVFTNQEKRDGHLQSADFFDAENHPEIRFESTAVEKLDDENYKVTGPLTIRGISNDVILDVEFGGIMKDPMGSGEKAGFSLNGKIKRKNWNLNWNAALEGGGVLVSDEVRIDIEIQLAKAQPVEVEA